ncbi:lysostaphin resistance A-like protein [Scytonema sp. NUACC26]|uniref:CPBP family intramembrane glutamic endopeptidase n=1 Tax=Scytonema sp. NUACC26 TaxID=3140176 RepID=UPI0034DBBE53
MQQVCRIFLRDVIPLFEPSANISLSSLQDAPALVVVMAFFLSWILGWVPLAAISAIAIKWKPFQPLQPEQKLPLLIPLYLLAPLILWGTSWLTKTSFSEYGFSGNISTFSSLALGLSLGVLGIAAIFSGQIWLGWCAFQETNLKQVRPILLPILLVALLVGGVEELIFRGFLLTELGKNSSIWTAAIASSLIFALLHLVWEQQETIPQLPGLWLMGMVLVLARFTDKGSIGLAWGLHAGWVWAIACLDTAQLVNPTDCVSEWVTGKNKKPLAGVAGVVCLLLTGGILWLRF